MKSLGLVCVFVIAAAAALLAQSNPVPLVQQPLVPMNAAPGGAGFTLTVNGAGFTSGSVVNWDGSQRATTFVSSTQLSATIDAADIAAAGTFAVTVSTPAPGGGTSNVDYFAVTTPTLGPLYITKSTYNVNQAISMVSADFNNDGKQDMAMAVIYGTVDVILGNGDGTFQTTQVFSSGPTPNALVTADFNHDGRLDLATANNNGTISILLGNGNGTFQSHIDSPTGSKSTGLAAGDFNGDGIVDLAVANFTASGGVSILLGKGDGTFQPQVVYPAGTFPYGVTVADFNRDGKLDLAVVNDTSAGAASVLLGVGDGTFQRAKVLPLGAVSPVSILAADLNADGNVDLVVGELSGTKVAALLGRGDGTFSAPRTQVAGAGPYFLATADFNGDGILDVAVGSGTVLLGKGDGTFKTQQSFYLGGYGLAVGDFNGDGMIDLASDYSDSLQTTAKVSATSLRFGRLNVGQISVPQSVTLYNYGGSALPITSIAMSGNFTEKDTCGTSLAAGSTCQISVVFAPRKMGTLSGALTITDAAVGSPQNVSLTGEGVAPNVLLSPTSLTFSAQTVGTTSAPQTVTVTNNGDATLTFSGVTASGDFAENTTCTTSLRVGQDCTVIVTFTPTATGTRTGTITINDNAPDTPQNVPLTGTGQ